MNQSCGFSVGDKAADFDSKTNEVSVISTYNRLSVMPQLKQKTNKQVI